MEVTTVSPSPASPTEGDDLCEIDATSVAIDSVTLLICLCGLAGNGAVLWLLSLERCTFRFFDLAVIDFLFLLFAFPSALLFLVEDISCSPIMPLMYVNFIFQLSLLSYYWVLFRLIPLSPVLYTRNFCRVCYCCCDLPKRLLWVADSVQYWAFFSVFTVIPAVAFLCQSQEQEHCRAALISVYVIMLLLFVAPMVISRTIDFINAKWGSQHQPKRRDIVIFLIVLFTLLLSFCNFLQQLGYILVSPHFFFLLTCINSSFKPFIYFLAGRCWRPCSIGSLRLSLQRVFEEPKEKTDHSDDPAMDTVI